MPDPKAGAISFASWISVQPLNKDIAAIKAAKQTTFKYLHILFGLLPFLIFHTI